ncbi:MAG: redox-sensing transcriptional repressor Rex [Candidatus Hydrogenedentes bacterium]|nr:redox-sensing transcriptional repressor Rex [Candidatus Hydrogenedentota bacterium]
MDIASQKTIERLSLYRRLLLRLRGEGETVVFSRQLCVPVGVTPAQVRRDIMQLGCSGVPHAGYQIKDLLAAIAEVLDAPQSQRAVLVGLGHLGRSLLTHFSGRWRWLHIHAAFDVNPARYGLVVRGCNCYALEQLPSVIQEWRIDIGVITVPMEQAQSVATLLCDAGITGVLNFAPTRLQVPEHVYVENVDLTTSFEKVAYFARRPARISDMKEADQDISSDNSEADIPV